LFDWQWGIAMTKMFLVVLFGSCVGAGAAFAGGSGSSGGGLPAGTVPPVYGSQAFPNQPYHTGTMFQEILDYLKYGHAQPARMSERDAPPNKGV
jgi:hypothetical protein